MLAPVEAGDRGQVIEAGVAHVPGEVRKAFRLYLEPDPVPALYRHLGYVAAEFGFQPGPDLLFFFEFAHFILHVQALTGCSLEPASRLASSFTAPSRIASGLTGQPGI